MLGRSIKRITMKGINMTHSNTDAAHAARRGQKDTLETKLARTATRYMLGIGIGPHEIAFTKLLDAKGIKYRQQFPCGPYNLDFTIDKSLVAVEIVTGSGNNTIIKNRQKRLEYVLARHHLFEVRFAQQTGPWGQSRVLTSKVVEQLIAFLKETRLYKTTPGKHWVIRPNGEVYPIRDYRAGHPIQVTETQIKQAEKLISQRVPKYKVWRIVGIPRHQFKALISSGKIQSKRNSRTVIA